MENDTPDIFSSTGIKIEDTARRHIAGIASWAMIIVVTAVIGYALTLFQLFSRPKATVTRSEGFENFIQASTDNRGFGILGILIGLLINYFLYQFAVQSRKSISELNPAQLGASFRNLKIYFLITTVIMIIVCLFVLIAVVVAV